MRYAGLRYFYAAGATGKCGEDHDPELHLTPIVLQVALGKREGVHIFGDDYDTVDGTCVRDYIHIKDLAQAHILALGALDKGSCVDNLGNGAMSHRRRLPTKQRNLMMSPADAPA
jgi:UDP-glucose 4-epimerase